MEEDRENSLSPCEHDTDEVDVIEKELEPEPDHTTRFIAYLPLQEASYNFHRLEAVYGSDFAMKLTGIWPAVFEHEGEASTRKWFDSILRTLLEIAYIGEEFPRSEAGQVYVHLRDRPSEALDPKMFEEAVRSVVTRVSNAQDNSVVNSTKSKTRRGFIEALNGALRRLASHRFFPALGPFKSNIPNSPFEPKLPTLAELTRTGRSPVPVAMPRALSLGEHVTAMVDLNVERLGALRACLEREFIAEYDAFKLGQMWASREDIPDAPMVEAAINAVSQVIVPNLQSKGRENPHPLPGRFLDRLKGELGAPTDVDLKAILVCYFRKRYPQGWKSSELPVAYRELLAYFGSNEIVRHIESTARATTAAFGILLIDTAFNVASLEDLPANPFVSKGRHGQRRIATIAARKMRARGKRVEGTLLGASPIEGEEADLPLRISEVKLSGIDVIECYMQMTRPLRDRARAQRRFKVARKFWLISSGRSACGGAVTNRLTTMNSTWWPDFLQRQADDPVIGGLRITRRHIRGTVIQIRSARSGFGHAIAQAVAEHSQDATTVSYLGAGWFRAQLASQIRVFQDLYEAVLSSGIENVDQCLNIDQTELSRREDLARSVGLDFTCSQHIVEQREILSHGPSCDPQHPCDICPIRQFIPSDENFRFLHLAHKALAQAEPKLIAQNPRRWLLVWLSWRALTEAYVRKIRRSPHKVRYEQAVRIVEADLVRGDVVLPLIY
jgi:hypothetical protein